MIEKEGKMQVEITGAWFEEVETEEGLVDIAKITFENSHGNSDELSMWMSSKTEQRGKYKDKSQAFANLDRLKNIGMTDGNPAKIENIVGESICVFGKLKEKEDRSFYVFYFQDGSKRSDPEDVIARLKRIKGETEAMAGTPVDDKKADNDNLPF